METTRGSSKNYSPEVRERAVKRVLEHEADYECRWSAIRSIAIKIGCHPKTLGLWLSQRVQGRGSRPGATSAETINGLYKSEVIHRQSWQTRAQVEMATLQWVDWFNQRRLLGPIGYIPPVEAEMRYYQQQTENAKAA